MVLALDPSYSSTGLAIIDDSNLVAYTTIRAAGECYKSSAACDTAAIHIVHEVMSYIVDYNITEIIIEVPAFQSKTGAYLAVLHGMLVMSLRCVAPITLVPCTAVDSFIRNRAHSKSYIVQYCKDNGWVPNKRINNDVCTAVVLGHLLYAINSGSYKNSYSRL